MEKFYKLLSLLMLSLFLTIGINETFATIVTVTLVDENGVALANYPPSTSEMSYKYRCGGSWVSGGNVQTNASGQFTTSDITCGSWDGKITLGLHQVSMEKVVTAGAVTFQAARVNVNLKNECTGLITESPGGTVKQGGGHWYTHGTTAGTGVVTFYTFPGNVKITMGYHWKSLTQNPVAIAAGTNEVDFLTTTVDYTYDGVVKHQSGSWNIMTFPFELLQGNHNIKFGSTLKTIAISGCAITENVHIFKTKKADGSALPNIKISRNDYGNHYVTVGYTDASGELVSFDQPDGTWKFKAYKDHTQQYKTAPPSTITFQTAKFMVHAKKSDCTTDFPGIKASFNDYGNHYLSMGNTDVNGLASIELFPGNYKFKAYKDHTDKTGMLNLATSGATGEVVLQTSEYVVHVTKADGLSDFPGIKASFNDYGNHYLSMGNTDANGKAEIELFPGNRKFKAYKDHTYNTGFLDIPNSCSSDVIEFQTALVTSFAKDCDNNDPIQGISMSFNDYGNHYLSMGNTDVFGIATLELFPGIDYKFKGYTIHTYATQTLDLPASGVTVEFNPTGVCFNYPGTVKFNDYGNHWLSIPCDTYMFQGTYDFRFYDGSTIAYEESIAISGCSMEKTIAIVRLRKSDNTPIANQPAEVWTGVAANYVSIGNTNADGLALAVIDGNQSSWWFKASYLNHFEKRHHTTLATNSYVDFTTVPVTMNFLKEDNSPHGALPGYSLLYNSLDVSPWNYITFGTGETGTSIEMLPISYYFKVIYLGQELWKSQDVGGDANVTFNTKVATMYFRTEAGVDHPDPITAEYSLKSTVSYSMFGDGTNGTSMEMLPTSYWFRVTHTDGELLWKSQDIDADAVVILNTKAVTFELVPSGGGTPIAGAVSEYNWPTYINFGTGLTTNPATTIELVPGTYWFRCTYSGDQFYKSVNIASNPLVTFTWDGSELKQSEIGSENVDISIYPNPFNTTTTLEFSLEKEQKVIVAVFDIRGKLVKTLMDRNLPEGEHKITWDSNDQYGSSVKQGVYFVKLITADEVDQKTIVKMR